MTIDQIVYFLETAKLLNFTKAANNLHITQQGLSYSISGLEKELELKLFHRTTRTIELTKAGEVLFWEWRKIPGMIENSMKEARLVSEENNDKIRIGIVELPGLFSFAELLMEQLMEKYPQREFECEFFGEMNGQELLECNYVDIIICLSCAVEMQNENYGYCQLKETPLSFIVSNTHRLAKEKKIIPADIEKENFLISQEDISAIVTIITHCFGKEPDKNKIIRYSNSHSLELALKAGRGIFIGFEEQFRKKDQKLVFIPLQKDRLYEEVYLVGVWKKSREEKISDIIPFFKI